MSELIVAAAQIAERFGDVDESVRAHAHLAELAAKRGARLVIFPELSLTGYERTLTRNDAIALGDARLVPLYSLARQRAITIVAGAPVASADGLHIGALTIFPDGSGSEYRKEFLHTGEEVAFAPGTGNHPIEIAGEVVALAVCADVVHPEHSAGAAKDEATIYAAGCYVTENGHGEFQNALSVHAGRHGMLMLLANYAAPTRDFDCAGKSAIWSPSGDLIASAGKTGQAIVLAMRQKHGWGGEMLPVR